MALDLTALVAQRAPARHNRFAARWLRYYLEEREPESLDEIVFVIGCLMALTGDDHELALAALRDVTSV